MTNAGDYVNWEGISIGLEDDHDEQEGSEGSDASAFVMHEVFFSNVVLFPVFILQLCVVRALDWCSPSDRIWGSGDFPVIRFYSYI